ncbi:hypothetical protein [Gluconobacter morbifer]|nr:hypothetical protein [Gluconobacter morbifer]
MLLSAFPLLPAVVLFYLSTPSQCLLPRPFPGWAGWLSGLGFTALGTVLLCRILQPVAAVLLVAALLMTGCIVMAIIASVIPFRTGRLS